MAARPASIALQAPKGVARHSIMWYILSSRARCSLSEKVGMQDTVGPVLLLLILIAAVPGCSSEVDPAAGVDQEEFTEKAYDDPAYLEQTTRTAE